MTLAEKIALGGLACQIVLAGLACLRACQTYKMLRKHLVPPADR